MPVHDWTNVDAGIFRDFHSAWIIHLNLFLDSDFYINIPLEATYQAAYRGVPAFWRDVLEAKQPTVSQNNLDN
ncbi:MAG: hypothetical protein ACHRXM_06380 [Isosphaerales bacterium]